MPKTLIKTGKTVEAALSDALTELGVTEDEVEYAVLEQPNRMLFGIISKPARIRVTVIDKEEPKEKTEEEFVGKIEPQPATFDSSGTPQCDTEPPVSTTDEAGEPAKEQQLPHSEKLARPQLAEEMERAEVFLKELFVAMRIPVQLERRDYDDYGVFNLVGERLGVLIGKHGITLDAIQYLTNLAVNKGNFDDRVHIIIDVENYRHRRDDALRELAMRLADKARYSNQEVRLEPMNRHERKIIHTALQDNKRVETRSAGEEPYRYVIVSPKKSGGYR